jgi:hypothetical protein
VQIPADDLDPNSVVPKQLNFEGLTFACNSDGDVPTTVMQLESSEEQVIIRWSSKYFEEAGYDPETRCRQVTARLDKYAKENTLLYAINGEINQQPVLCLTSESATECGEGLSEQKQDGLIFTLKSATNALEKLERFALLLEGNENTEVLEE